MEIQRSAGLGIVAALVGLAACGAVRGHTRHAHPLPPVPTSRSGTTSTGREVRSRPPRLIAVLPGAHRRGRFGWTAAVAVRGRPAVWMSRVPAHGEAGFTITLLRLDQQLVTLALHAGGAEPGGTGWRYGDAIAGRERRVVVAAFNSAFRESYGAGGFQSGGRVGWPLRLGAASVVMYRDGSADIGRWRVGIPAPGRAVAAVRQNLGLLIDRRRIASTVDRCVKVCWGDPLHEQPIVARSGLGITASGELLWAAGHDLSVRALADALLAKGAVRAMELDINPRWVAGYVYAHSGRRAAPSPVALVPGQTGIPGRFLAPYFRDFLSVIARRGAVAP